MKIGTAKDVLPLSLPTTLVGHRIVRKAFVIGDELHVRSIALVNGDNIVFMVSVELLWLDKFHVNEIRAKICKEVNVPLHNILVACTHTHSGPDTLEWKESSSPEHKLWLDLVIDRISNTSIRAFSKLVDCSVDLVETDVDIATNRRLMDETGVYRLKPNPSGVTSQRFRLLRFCTLKGDNLAGIITHIAHPVVLGEDSHCISADWCGLVCSKIELKLGVICLYFNGASGDQNPKIWTGKSYAEMEEMAQHVAQKSLMLFSLGQNLELELPLQVVSKILKFQGKEHPYLLRAQAKRIQNDGNISIEVQLIKIGSVIIVGLPGECLIETGFEIEHVIKGYEIIIISYSNDYVGYLPMAHIFEEGGYESYATMLTSGEIALMVDIVKKLIVRLAHS
ncbi:MAG: hypothetical protein U0X91_00540 [Spirosomataceae bacterium]